MTTKKQNRRKAAAKKLEPIDWREFANDAVLNGNMSTLYRRPPSEDPSAYASAEALIEIEKRVVRSMQDSVADVDRGQSNDLKIPTVGRGDTEGSKPSVGTLGLEPIANKPTVLSTVGPTPAVGMLEPDTTDILSERQTNTQTQTMGIRPTVPSLPTAPLEPTVGMPPIGCIQPTVDAPTTVSETPTVGSRPPAVSAELHNGPLHILLRQEHKASKPTGYPGPTEGTVPTVGAKPKTKIKPIRDVQDALTLAGQILYRAMFSAPDGSSQSVCTRGYRQLAAQTRLDKDTVRDLIVEFKQKGIVRETATYDPDTRLAKTYEVFSNDRILQLWREAGLHFVTAGRQRPQFCSPDGQPIIPTMGS